MIVDFNTIPNYCKLWVFPSSRKFYPQEIADLQQRIEAFLTNWTNEGNPIECSYSLKYDRFIVITANDAEISLTLKAHDDLTAFILGLEAIYNIVLLDKINVCYKQGAFVQYKDLIAFKKMMKNNGVSKKTTVFDNMITTKEELENDWEINIMDSWLGRLLK